MEAFVIALLWFSALSAGIMAGVYFAFSAFIMKAFSDLSEETAAWSMKSINKVILGSAFMPLFFASSLSCAVLVVLGLVQLGEPGWLSMVAGGVVYVIGMFGVSASRNVPLNKRLEGGDPRSSRGKRVWRDYQRSWTRWNHVRTLASIAAMLLLLALVERA